MNYSDKLDLFFGGAGALTLIVLLLMLGPALFIWSVNTLFGLNIAFTFWNWLASFVLLLLIRGDKSSSKK